MSLHWSIDCVRATLALRAHVELYASKWKCKQWIPLPRIQTAMPQKCTTTSTHRSISKFHKGKHEFMLFFVLWKFCTIVVCANQRWMQYGYANILIVLYACKWWIPLFSFVKLSYPIALIREWGRKKRVYIFHARFLTFDFIEFALVLPGTKTFVLKINQIEESIVIISGIKWHIHF